VQIHDDRGGMLEAFLAELRERMRALGSRRVQFKGGAFWDYKREFSFCGDIDFIPTDEYDAADADTAIGQARRTCRGPSYTGHT